jgi:hypothetical protein
VTPWCMVFINSCHVHGTRRPTHCRAHETRLFESCTHTLTPHFSQQKLCIHFSFVSCMPHVWPISHSLNSDPHNIMWRVEILRFFSTQFFFHPRVTSSFLIKKLPSVHSSQNPWIKKHSAVLHYIAPSTNYVANSIGRYHNRNPCYSQTS